MTLFVVTSPVRGSNGTAGVATLETLDRDKAYRIAGANGGQVRVVEDQDIPAPTRARFEAAQRQVS